MLRIYKILSILLVPIIIVNIFIRIYRKKEDRVRFVERFGKPTIKKNNEKKILWIHAASIGEFKSSDLIIDRYNKVFNILVTTTTKSSAEYIIEFYKNKVVHQYIPFDIAIWCSRFLNFWKPNLILWIESDIWPNMLNKIRERNINCLYLNARISPNSFKKWKNTKKFYRGSLKNFNKIFAQSANDKIRIHELTNLPIDYIGNLKLAKNINNPAINKDQSNIITIASTHSNEEEKIIRSIKKTIREFNLRIYLAPRHPERINTIKQKLNKEGFSISLETKNEDEKNNIVIIDSFGRLDKYFKISNLVILGGSFLKNIGGHNPIEPASYGCAIISGKYVDNWTNIYEDMVKSNSCIIVNKFEDIDLKMKELLNNNLEIKKIQTNALEFSNRPFFEKEKLFQNIEKYINKNA
tara:strand:- start:607 stop:1836 length:1230 start_codon:yes stop_codon:yes gene_type:complete